MDFGTTQRRFYLRMGLTWHTVQHCENDATRACRCGNALSTG